MMIITMMMMIVFYENAVLVTLSGSTLQFLVLSNRHTQIFVVPLYTSVFRFPFTILRVAFLACFFSPHIIVNTSLIAVNFTLHICTTSSLLYYRTHAPKRKRRAVN